MAHICSLTPASPDSLTSPRKGQPHGSQTVTQTRNTTCSTMSVVKLIPTNTWKEVGTFVAQVVLPVTLKARKRPSTGEGTPLRMEVAMKPYTPMLPTLHPCTREVPAPLWSGSALCDGS